TPSIQEAKPPEAARKLSRLPTFLKPKNLREPAASDQFADATKSHVAPSPAASRNKRRKIAPEREPAGQLPSKGAADGGPPGPPNRGLLLDAVPTYYSDTVSYSPVQSLAARRKRKLRKPAASAAPAAANRPKRIVMADVVPQDSRECALCGLVGDSEANGRMLFLECGRWVHAHCAYWSEMVAYDPPSASLESVPEAWVHHHCALEAGCSFFADKRMFCAAHGAGAKPVDWSGFLVPGAAAKPKGRKGKTPANADAVPPQPSAEAIGYFTKNLPVRLAVQSSATFAFLRSSTETRNNSVLRFGSVLLYNLGRIPADDPYCTDRHIYPVGYRIRRMYWSSLVPDRRCFYTCEIVEKPCRDMSCGDEKDVPVELEFVITPEEDVPVPPFVDSSATGAWAALAKKIRETRGNTVYPANGINGEHMFGLTHPCIGEAIERLPNAERCAEYRFRYLCPTAADERQTLEFSPTVLWDPVLLRSGWATNLPENVAGCARCQPYGRWREKRSAAAAAAHRGSSSRSHASGTGGGGGASSCAPTPAAFAGQESGGGGFSGAGNSEMARTNYARYRQLRKSARLHRVVPSRISGFGLLASRAYSKDRMIIEYVGEVIGQKLADRRESIYEKQNRGCYMKNQVTIVSGETGW
ncbi:MAG: F/Y rich C-terminus-domain-containing protein, partial [Olpidium bornovanus]